MADAAKKLDSRDPARLRELGKLGGRPKGSMSRAKQMMRDLATRIVTDLDVQNRLLQQAKDGTLHPAVMREFFHYHGGRPPIRVEVAPASARGAELVSLLRRLPKRDRLALAEISARAQALALALPAAQPVGRVIDVKATRDEKEKAQEAPAPR